MLNRGILPSLLTLASIYLLPNPVSAQELVYEEFMIGAALGQPVGQALGGAAQAGRARALMEIDLGRTRAAFWDAYPDGPGFEEASASFARALLEKDLYYLMLDLAEDGRGISKIVKVMTGGELDGGIPERAKGAFSAWTSRIRLVSGGGPGGTTILNPDALAEEEAVRAYQDYRAVRDKVELYGGPYSPAILADTPEEKLRAHVHFHSDGELDVSEAAERLWTTLREILGPERAAALADELASPSRSPKPASELPEETLEAMVAGTSDPVAFGDALVLRAWARATSQGSLRLQETLFRGLEQVRAIPPDDLERYMDGVRSRTSTGTLDCSDNRCTSRLIAVGADSALAEFDDATRVLRAKEGFDYWAAQMERRYPQSAPFALREAARVWINFWGDRLEERGYAEAESIFSELAVRAEDLVADTTAFGGPHAAATGRWLRTRAYVESLCSETGAGLPESGEGGPCQLVDAMIAFEQHTGAGDLDGAHPRSIAQVRGIAQRLRSADRIPDWEVAYAETYAPLVLEAWDRECASGAEHSDERVCGRTRAIERLREAWDEHRMADLPEWEQRLLGVEDAWATEMLTQARVLRSEAHAQGWTSLGEGFLQLLAEDDDPRYSFDFPTREVLISAVCNASCSELYLEVSDASGDRIVESEDDIPHPSVRFLMPAEGSIRLDVDLRSCSTRACGFVLQAFGKN